MVGYGPVFVLGLYIFDKKYTHTCTQANLLNVSPGSATWLPYWFCCLPFGKDFLCFNMIFGAHPPVLKILMFRTVLELPVLNIQNWSFRVRERHDELRLEKLVRRHQTRYPGPLQSFVFYGILGSRVGLR